MIKNEKGLTLVELLATLALLSIVTILIWNVFLQGANHSNKETTKNLLTQEMYNVQFNLRKIHQTSDKYIISFPSPCSIKIENATNTIIFDSNKICYVIQESDGSNFALVNSWIYPKTAHNNIKFKLTLEDTQNENNKINSHTILSRLEEQ